jgi:glycosyltransferase involved in cell wall biosynthesis
MNANKQVINTLLIGPYPPPIGGQSILVETMFAHGLEYGINFTLFDIAHEEPRFSKRIWVSLGFFIRLFRLLLLQGRQLDLVHIHTSAGGPLMEKCLMAELCRLFAKPVILHIHGGKLITMFNQYRGIKRRVLDFVLSIPSAFVVLSPKMREVLIKEAALKTDVFVLPNPSRIDPTSATAINAKNDAGFLSLLFVGHIKREKGLCELLEAFKKLQSAKLTAKKIRLFVVGAGDTPAHEREIKSLFAKSGVNHVNFTGVLKGKDLIDMYQQADVFVLPSHSEDQPLTLIEAMSCGLPVVSTSVGSIPDIVKNGINGILVNPNDASDLYRALSEICTSEQLRSSMAEANRSLAIDRFGLQSYMNKLTNLYLNLLTVV